MDILWLAGATRAKPKLGLEKARTDYDKITGLKTKPETKPNSTFSLKKKPNRTDPFLPSLA